MAIDNPLKNFRFSLEINGIEALRVQKITPPTVELQEHKQGNAGNKPDTKTPGGKIVGDLILEMVIPGDSGDPEIWAALELAAQGLRSDYAGIGFLNELEATGNGVVSRFFLDEVWLKKVEPATDYDPRKENSADMMRTVTFSVGNYLRQ